MKLRIWLQASLLFTKQPDGTLQLTEDGKARIESAMGEFLKYVGSGPLVIEGYAKDGSSAQRFLDSRQRASLVGDFLADRFGLVSESVGVMPLGSDVSGSPDGNRWDGVALAVFVPPEAVRK